MRKLNVRWLAGLVVAPIILAGLAFLIHQFQMSRNASVFIRQAKLAQSQKRPRDAVDYLRRYVKLAPNDSEGLILYGFQLADLNSVQGAYLALEKAIGQQPKRNDVRQRLVDLSIKLGRFQDARDHLEKYLLKESPQDSELLELLATCQYAQSDFSGAEGSYLSSIQHAPDRVEAYVKLAALRNDKLEQPQEADDTINEMVQRNPESPQAFRIRAEWRIRKYFQAQASNNSTEAERLRGEVESDIKQALTIAPDNVDVLLSAARISSSFGQPDDARNHLLHGIEIHPTAAPLYSTLAELEVALGNIKAATEVLERGVDAIPRNLDLKWSLANQLIAFGNNTRAEELMAELRTHKYPAEMIAFLECRQLVHDNDWTAAIPKLNTTRPSLRERPSLAKQIDYWLGTAYRAKNSPDEALAVFRRAVATDPDWSQARLALAEILLAMNSPTEAVSEFRNVSSKPGAPLSALLGFERAFLQSNLSRRPTQRNWNEFDAMMKRIESIELEPKQAAALKSQLEILKVQRLLADEKRDDAEKVITAARLKNPDQIDLWTAQVNLAQNMRDWPRVERLIEEAQKQFGDTAAIRQLKGRLIAQRDTAEQARELLQPLSQPAPDWTDSQKNELAAEFAMLFLTIGDYADSERLASSVGPGSNYLASRLILLDVATFTKNAKLLDKVIEDIRVDTNEGAYWYYAQARRLTSQAEETKDAQLYEEAIVNLEKASATRGTWDRIHTLWGEIHDRQGQYAAAIEHYLEAFERGQRSVRISSRTLALLIASKRYDEAKRLLRLLRESQSPMTNEMVQAEVELMIQSGEKDDALKIVDKLASDPQSKIDPMWFGRTYILLDKLDYAENQYLASIKANPKLPLPWVSLVQLQMLAKQPDKAAATTEEAKAAIEGDLAAYTIGQCYEIIGNPKLAGEWYRQALSKSPENIEINRGWIEFLLRSSFPAEAEIALRTFIKKEDALKDADPKNRSWAQLRLVDALRLQGTQEKLTEALKLIDEHMKQNKQDSSEDLRKKAQVLAMFPDQKNRRAAIEILEKLVVQEAVLSIQLEERRLLADLYQMVGDLEKARSELRTIISTKKDDRRALVAYIQLSLQVKELTEAELYLTTLKRLAPDESSTADAEVLLLFERKRYTEILNLIESIDQRQILQREADAHLKKQGWVARTYAAIAMRLVQERKKDESERFIARAVNAYQKLIEEKPDESLTFAEFLVGTAHLDESLKLTQGHIDELTPIRLMRMIRGIMKNPQATPEHLAQYQEILRVFENKSTKPGEATSLKLLAADLLSWRGEYTESASRFEDVLRREPKNYIALNNLAFLLALTGGEHKKAMRLVTEAIEIVGEVDALLDTRGFVHLSAGNADAALIDFEKAASKSDSAERRLHAAVAYSRLKRREEAEKSLRTADEIGVVEAELHPIERATLAKLRKELNVPEPAAK